MGRIYESSEQVSGAIPSDIVKTIPVDLGVKALAAQLQRVAAAVRFPRVCCSADMMHCFSTASVVSETMSLNEMRPI